MSEPQRRDSGSLINEPLIGVTGGSNRATTTERRTTTTTTTKRTIKSSDDFIPSATDIQQVRSESRTGSISSSTGTPLFSPTAAATSTSSGMSQSTTSSSSSSASAQQQKHSAATSKTTTSSSNKQNDSETQTSNTNSNSGANNNNNNIGSSSSQTARNWTSSTTTSSTNATGGSGGGDGLQSPLIQDTEEGGRVLKLRFDVSQYEPDEIVVKTVDNRLTVQAKHEEKTENRSVYREYNREFHLPDGIDVELIKSSLSKEGILTVDCPLPAHQLQGASRRIPIDRV